MKNCFSKRNNIKLYNVIFPVWLLYFFPVTWFFVIPTNFVVDSLVLLLGMHILKIENKKDMYKKTIFWVFLFGFLSDFVGSFLLLTSQFMGNDGVLYEYLTYPLALNPFDNIYSLLFTFLAVILSGISIYIFNRFISFKKINDKRTKRIISLLLAVLTAPYLFLLPTSSFYGGKTESFTNHFVSTDYIMAEVYLEGNETEDILRTESGEHYNYMLVSAFRDGINIAKKTKKQDISDWDYKVVFYKEGNDSKRLGEIDLKNIDGNLYFEFKNLSLRLVGVEKMAFFSSR